MVENKSNAFGIASLILGIVSIIVVFVRQFLILGPVVGLLGIIFASKQRKVFPNGIANAGLVISIIGTAISFFFTLAYLFF